MADSFQLHSLGPIKRNFFLSRDMIFNLCQTNWMSSNFKGQGMWTRNRGSLGRAGSSSGGLMREINSLYKTSSN